MRKRRFKWIACAISILLPLTLFACRGDTPPDSTPGPVSSKEDPKTLYERLLSEKGREQDMGSLVDSLKLSPRYADIPRERLMKDYRGTLQRLLPEVLAQVPAQYRTQLNEVYAGLFPLRGMQAYSLLAENDGVLILVHQDLAIALTQWARVIADLLATEGLGKKEAEKLIAELGDSIKAYGANQEIPLFQQRATGGTSRNLAIILSVRATQFVLAHECAHAALGHLQQYTMPIANFVPRTDSDAENDADRVGLEILTLHYFQRKPIDADSLVELDFRIAGAYFAMSVMDALDHANLNDGPNYDAMFRVVAMRRLIRDLFQKTSRYDYPVTWQMVGLMQRVVEVVVVERKPLESLTGDNRLRATFLAAYKARKLSQMKELVRSQPVWFRKWAASLRSTASNPLTAGGVAGDWTDGEFLTASDLNALAESVEAVLAAEPRMRAPKSGRPLLRR